MKNPKTARPVHANRGIEAAYRKALSSLIEEMARSAEYWLTAGYRANPPRMAELAQDESPVKAIKAVIAL